MTDDKIITALECCSKTEVIEDCEGCPYYKHGCLDKVHADIIDLINSQKAEIERLEAMIDAAEEHFNPLPFKNNFDEYIEKAKAEAIKEFAERLKESAHSYFLANLIWVVTIDDINNLVKEMVGEE